MNRKLKFSLRAAVSILLLGYLSSSLDWSLIGNLRPDIFIIISMGAVIFFVAQCIMSFRWQLILDRLEAVSASYSYLVRLYTIGQFFNLLMPGSIGGDVVRGTSVATTYAISRKTSFTIIFSERFFGLSAISAMVVVGFVFYPVYIRETRMDECLAVVAAFGALIAFFVARHLVNRVSQLPFALALALLLISATAQLADVIITFLLARYFELEVGFVELLIVIPIVYFFTILPISLGGLGVREGAMVVLLSSFEVGESTAIIIAFCLYLTKLIVGLVGGLIYLRRGRRVNE